MRSPLKLLCWDHRPSPQLERLAARAAAAFRASFGPLSRFWVWVDRPRPLAGSRSGAGSRSVRRGARTPVPLAITGVAARSFHVRLVLELVMPPPGLDPSFTAESTRATAEGAFRNAHAALSVMIQARVQTTKGKGRRLGPLSAARSRAPVAPLVARTGRAGGLARA